MKIKLNLGFATFDKWCHLIATESKSLNMPESHYNDFLRNLKEQY